MRTLTYQKQCRLGKLYEEIVAAVPTLAPVTLSGDTFPTAQVLVEGTTTTTIVRVPDATADADVTMIGNVVAAHDPTTPAPDEAAALQQLANAQTLRQKVQTALTNNQAFLALADPTGANNTYLGLSNPTNAQVVAQVKALTQQNNALIAQAKALTRQTDALIRLAVGLLDTISDS